MSVVVALKKDGVVYLGCDSQVSRGYSKKTLSNENNYKIWKVNNVDECYFGHVGAVRDANAIRTITRLIPKMDVIEDNIDFDYVVDSIVPKMIRRLKDFNYIPDGVFDKMESEWIFVYKDKVYWIGFDGSVIEVDDYISIGSGSEVANGSLCSTDIKGNEPNDRIVSAIKASTTNDIFVSYPVILTSTKSEKYEVIFQ